MREPHRDSSGFALPAAILAMVVVGVLITGGIQLATQESRMGQAGERATRAFYVAESALNEVLATFNPGSDDLDLDSWGEPVVLGDSLEGGEAWMGRVHRFDEERFLVQVEGSVPAGPERRATRELSAITRVYTVPLDPPAAVATMGTVRVRGSAEVIGQDQQPGDWDDELCPEAADNLPGVVTDEDGDVDQGGDATVEGEPEPHVQDPDLTEDDFTEFGDTDWDDLTNMADHTIAPGDVDNPGPDDDGGFCNTGNPMNWGDPFGDGSPCFNYFPMIHITGDASLQGGGADAGYGQGVLLVDGDLHVTGGFEYYGIIVVQGTFSAAGGQNAPRISGGVMAAGAEVGDDDDSGDFTGSSIVQNSRCAVGRALDNNNGLNRLRLVDDRSWVDLTASGS